MKRIIVSSKAFEKSYRKFTNNNPALKGSIENALIKLQADIYDPSLRTHKLSGKLVAYFACSCGYDCRIIFTLEENISHPGIKSILLLDIGTHDSVY